METRIALVDCNNFYVSCERVFRPDLWGKPVAVMSNNDGCIVARSQEVKDLGIKMGAPVFQIEYLVKRHRIHLFSSNYTLYADMSARVMSLLEEFSPQIEIYSIDEAFLDLTGLGHGDPAAYARAIRQAILQTTGVTVCVGMGPTKTLAKLANFAAKKWPKTGGVLDLSDPVRRQRLMRQVPVREIWGVGYRLSQRLNELGIETAWDLAMQPVERIRGQFNVVLARTVMELNGIGCQSVEDVISPRQQIVSSRSFKRRLTDFGELAEALAEFCSRAALKLRQQQSLAGVVTVFIRTNPHNDNDPYYQRTASLTLTQATQDTRRLTAAAKKLLEQIFRAGYRYQQCGVQLSDLRPQSLPGQIDLFELAERVDSTRLMQTVDRINRRYHKKAVAVAATGLGERWQMPIARVSGHYTTDWNELVRVQCI